MDKAKTAALDEGRARFVEKLGQYYEGYGIPRIGGRIIGLLLVSAKPLSAEELAGMLRVSRSSVSTNVRLLLLYGFVEKAQGAGERTDYFTIAADAWRNAIRARVEGFRALKAIAAQGREALPGGDPAESKIAQMEKWADVMIEVHEEILERWMRK